MSSGFEATVEGVKVNVEAVGPIEATCEEQGAFSGSHSCAVGNGSIKGAVSRAEPTSAQEVPDEAIDMVLSVASRRQVVEVLAEHCVEALLEGLMPRCIVESESPALVSM